MGVQCRCSQWNASGVLGEDLTGTSNAGILPHEGNLGHVLPEALAHSEWLILSLLRLESFARVFLLYAHLLIISLAGVDVIILHLELRLGGWATAADR